MVWFTLVQCQIASYMPSICPARLRKGGCIAGREVKGVEEAYKNTSSIFLTFILFQPEYLALTLALLITLSSPHPLRLSSASSPKTAITLPDILLIHRSHRGVNFPRNRLIPPASRSHQSAEPRNTPQTTSVAERAVFLPPPTPSP